MSEKLAQRCLNAISRLPQRAALRGDHVRDWMLKTARIDLPRIEWHIRRAGGIGGSDISAILDWMWPGEGYRGRDTASRIARSKLLMLPPSRGNDDTERGVFLEDLVRTTFERKLTQQGRIWERRLDLKTAIEAGVHPEHPHLRCSLDDVYVIDGETHIVDYKAPSQDMLAEYNRRGDFGEYDAQLNHYAIKASGAGIPIDHLSLVMFDYKRAGTNGVDIFDRPSSPGLQGRIIEAAGVFWHDFVMRGLVPADELRRDNRDVPENIEEAARQVVTLKLAIGHLEDQLEFAKADIAAWMTDGTMLDGKLSLGKLGEPDSDGMLDITLRTSLDAELAVARLRELGKTEDEIAALTDNPGFEPKTTAQAYPLLLALVGDMARAADGTGPAVDVANRLKDITLGVKTKAATWNDDAVRESLVSCGEEAYMFSTGSIVQSVTRKRRKDKLLLSDRIKDMTTEFADHLACEDPRYEIGEASAPAMVA